MKFSSSLKFNAVAEWWDEYIAYDTLKKYVYQLEKQQAGLHEAIHDLEANEGTSLIQDRDIASKDALFIPLLDRELKKMCSFYELQETNLLREVNDLEKLVQQQEEYGPDIGHQYLDHVDEEDDDDDDDDDDFAQRSPAASWSRSPLSRRKRSLSESTGLRGASGSNWRSEPSNRRYSISSNEDHVDLEASIVSLRSANGEPSGAHLSPPPAQERGNSVGRSPIRAARTLANKIFMKDSVTSSMSAPETVWTAKTNYARDIQLLFKRRITNLYLSATSLRSYVELNYSGFRKILKKYDKVLESNLKDHYLHDVVEQASPFTMSYKDKLNHTCDHLVEMYARCVTHGDFPTAKRQLKLNQREHIAWERDTVWRQMIGQARRGDGNSGNARAQGGTLVGEPEKGLLDLDTPAGHFKLTTKHLFVLVSVIIFAVLLNVKTVDGEEANRCFAILVFATLLWATEAIPLFVTSMLIPLLLVCLRVIRSSANQDGETERLGAVGATNNVAAPTLCFTLIKLGIALAANIGGQSSPISSPQNLIAYDYMDSPLDWAKWFAVALPVSALSIFLIWLLLLVSYKPARSPDGEGDIEIKPIRPSRDPFTLQQYWVCFICLVTIILWCVEHEIADFVGDMGIIAIIPIVAFFSTGVLHKEDFDQFLWTVVFLAMGGIALGKGVTSSGLIEVMDEAIRTIIGDMSLYAVVIVLCCIVLVVSTFISHTIASVLLVPIAKTVGSRMPGQPENLLIFITALACSTGMGMPVSGFPNQTAATQEDDMGQLYLSNVDFLKNGGGHSGLPVDDCNVSLSPLTVLLPSDNGDL
ncbi:hypothetical protein PHLCEN_2v1933 [Hermanssonia centrifuga]|uniref:SPX domain-containing protein n=1 Tax=Hermanssonia centrifuga TaxID=98765 RepID=A0A2R6RVH2_9APHY|nr:hypothetical protein PHLCEN_2v1933 [Hermanssonia centrifuga]